MTLIPRPIGASASSIWAHLCDHPKLQNGDYPHDAGDFGRCEAFLQSQPQLRAEFPRMAEVNDYWRFLLTSWDVIAMAAEAERSSLIQAIIAPLEKIDPTCGKMGKGITIRSGPITFKLIEKPDPEPDHFTQAVMLVWQENNASTSFLQRRLGIGYNAASRLIERMEEMAIISKADSVGKREVHDPDAIKQALGIKDMAERIMGSPDDAKDLIAAIINECKDKPMPAASGHNSGEATYAVTADELRQFIERFEQLDAEKKDLAEQQKELMAEAKGRGYDTRVMRMVVALRKRKPDDLAEEEAVLELYKSALGMA